MERVAKRSETLNADCASKKAMTGQWVGAVNEILLEKSAENWYLDKVIRRIALCSESSSLAESLRGSSTCDMMGAKSSANHNPNIEVALQ
jgi:hypothetical protein